MAKKKTSSSQKALPKKTARPTQKAPKAAARVVTAELVDDHSTELQEASTTSPRTNEPVPSDPEFLIDPDIADLDDKIEEQISQKLLAPTGKKKAAGGNRALSTADPISLYLQEVRRYPVLTREQESELAKRYFETKDPKAAQALVTANLRFVVKVAAEYSKFGARLIDLVQEGNMGLMHAVKDFNPYKNVRLITYAVWWIRGYIQEYLMKQYSLVKIGTTHNQKKLFYRLQKEKEALDALGENPTMALIGTKLGIPAEEVQEMALRLKGRDVSLSQPFDDESKSSLGDFQKSDAQNPDEELAKHEELTLLRQHLKELTPQLNEREKILLEERILADEPLTLQEIGEKYGITREAVRQLESRLMEKIKKGFKDDLK
ncbi:MAG: RNA polymerase factor sigma-32 [Bdellovibrio sp.]|jgi:RNA polymerase sigma-32 factor